MKYLTIFISVISFALTGNAQEVISSGGGDNNSGNTRLSWTIGEPVIETAGDAQNTLTQGFHQTKLTVTAIDDIFLEGLNISVYPNPVSYSLTIDVTEDKFEDLGYRLFDMNGKILLNKQLDDHSEEINMQQYCPGSYLLKVIGSNGKKAQTFQIIKR